MEGLKRNSHELHLILRGTALPEEIKDIETLVNTLSSSGEFVSNRSLEQICRFLETIRFSQEVNYELLERILKCLQMLAISPTVSMLLQNGVVQTLVPVYDNLLERDYTRSEIFSSILELLFLIEDLSDSEEGKIQCGKYFIFRLLAFATAKLPSVKLHRAAGETLCALVTRSPDNQKAVIDNIADCYKLFKIVLPKCGDFQLQATITEIFFRLLKRGPQLLEFMQSTVVREYIESVTKRKNVDLLSEIRKTVMLLNESLGPSRSVYSFVAETIVVNGEEMIVPVKWVDFGKTQLSLVTSDCSGETSNVDIVYDDLKELKRSSATKLELIHKERPAQSYFVQAPGKESKVFRVEISFTQEDLARIEECVLHKIHTRTMGHQPRKGPEVHLHERTRNNVNSEDSLRFCKSSIGISIPLPRRVAADQPQGRSSPQAGAVPSVPTTGVDAEDEKVSVAFQQQKIDERRIDKPLESSILESAQEFVLDTPQRGLTVQDTELGHEKGSLEAFQSLRPDEKIHKDKPSESSTQSAPEFVLETLERGLAVQSTTLVHGSLEADLKGQHRGEEREDACYGTPQSVQIKNGEFESSHREMAPVSVSTVRHTAPEKPFTGCQEEHRLTDLNNTNCTIACEYDKQPLQHRTPAVSSGTSAAKRRDRMTIVTRVGKDEHCRGPRHPDVSNFPMETLGKRFSPNLRSNRARKVRAGRIGPGAQTVRSAEEIRTKNRHDSRLLNDISLARQETSGVGEIRTKNRHDALVNNHKPLTLQMPSDVVTNIPLGDRCEQQQREASLQKVWQSKESSGKSSPRMSVQMPIENDNPGHGSAKSSKNRKENVQINAAAVEEEVGAKRPSRVLRERQCKKSTNYFPDLNEPSTTTESEGSAQKKVRSSVSDPIETDTSKQRSDRMLAQCKRSLTAKLDKRFSSTNSRIENELTVNHQSHARRRKSAAMSTLRKQNSATRSKAARIETKVTSTLKSGRKGNSAEDIYRFNAEEQTRAWNVTSLELSCKVRRNYSYRKRRAKPAVDESYNPLHNPCQRSCMTDGPSPVTIRATSPVQIKSRPKPSERLRSHTLSPRSGSPRGERQIISPRSPPMTTLPRSTSPRSPQLQLEQQEDTLSPPHQDLVQGNVERGYSSFAKGLSPRLQTRKTTYFKTEGIKKGSRLERWKSFTIRKFELPYIDSKDAGESSSDMTSSDTFPLSMINTEFQEEDAPVNCDSPRGITLISSLLRSFKQKVKTKEKCEVRDILARTSQLIKHEIQSTEQRVQGDKMEFAEICKQKYDQLEMHLNERTSTMRVSYDRFQKEFVEHLQEYEMKVTEVEDVQKELYALAKQQGQEHEELLGQLQERFKSYLADADKRMLAVGQSSKSGMFGLKSALREVMEVL